MTEYDTSGQILSHEILESGVSTEDSNKLKDNLITLSQKNNLLDEFEDIDEVQRQITEQYGTDKGDMSDYLDDYENAFALAKMNADEEVKTVPFTGSSKVMAPILIEASNEFNARYKVDVSARKYIADFEVTGKDTQQLSAPAVAGQQEVESEDSPKEARAKRNRTYFNKKLKQGSWMSETDMEMLALPIVGTTYKKTIFEERKKRIESLYVAANKIIFSQSQSFDKAPQVVHELDAIPRNALIGNLHAGIWKFDESELDEDEQEFDGWECHFLYDHDEDGYAEPYIATYIEDLDAIVRIRAGFIEEGIHIHDGKITEIERKEYFSQKKLMPDPEGGPMGLGFGIILSHTYESINATLCQSLDAGTLANVAGNSGLIANASSPKMGMDGRMSEGPIEIEIGKLKNIQVSSGQSLAQNVVQLPFKGANPVTFQLMQYLEDSARRFSTVSYNIESSPNEAASLYLARLSQSMKAYNAMMCRVYEGLTKEFEIIARCMYEYADVLQPDYERVLDEQADMAADFNPDDCDVTPTANPAHGSDAERMAKSTMMLDLLITPAGQSMNQREVVLNYLEASGIENAEKYYPEPPQGPSPMEQQQNQFLMMEAEFRNREMEVKEKELSMKEMKTQLEALHAAAKFEQSMKESQSKIDVNIATSLEKMNRVAIEKIGQYQLLIDRAEQNITNDVKNIKPTIGQTDGNNDQRGLTNVAFSAGNQAIPEYS